MGSNVISGSATAVVICVGDHTLFGSMAAAVAGEAVETSFTKGVNAVSWVLIRFMLVMVPLVDVYKRQPLSRCKSSWCFRSISSVTVKPITCFLHYLYMFILP